jgi:hypothetical protein
MVDELTAHGRLQAAVIRDLVGRAGADDQETIAVPPPPPAAYAGYDSDGGEPDPDRPEKPSRWVALAHRYDLTPAQVLVAGMLLGGFLLLMYLRSKGAIS